MSQPSQKKHTIKKKCKFPNCRKMASNLPDISIEQIEHCCKDHINMVKTYEKPDECLICCEQFIENCPLFPCCHWVCKNCIIKSGKEECPVCRQLVILSKEELKYLTKQKKKIEDEKRQTQLAEDRQLAEQIAQEMIRAMHETNVLQVHRVNNNRHVVHLQHIVITEENEDEIMNIINILEEPERTLYMRMLQRS